MERSLNKPNKIKRSIDYNRLISDKINVLDVSSYVSILINSQIRKRLCSTADDSVCLTLSDLLFRSSTFFMFLSSFFCCIMMSLDTRIGSYTIANSFKLSVRACVFSRLFFFWVAGCFRLLIFVFFFVLELNSRGFHTFPTL